VGGREAKERGRFCVEPSAAASMSHDAGVVKANQCRARKGVSRSGFNWRATTKVTWKAQ